MTTLTQKNIDDTREALVRLYLAATEDAGLWNGDESGTLEDYSTLCDEIAHDTATFLGKLKELEDLV